MHFICNLCASQNTSKQKLSGERQSISDILMEPLSHTDPRAAPVIQGLKREPIP